MNFFKFTHLLLWFLIICKPWLYQFFFFEFEKFMYIKNIINEEGPKFPKIILKIFKAPLQKVSLAHIYRRKCWSHFSRTLVFSSFSEKTGQKTCVHWVWGTSPLTYYVSKDRPFFISVKSVNQFSHHPNIKFNSDLAVKTILCRFRNLF